MKTINLIEVFGNRLFRIPDYQRGYSWEFEHLKAIWEDLENLKIRTNNWEKEKVKWKTHEEALKINSHYYIGINDFKVPTEPSDKPIHYMGMITVEERQQEKNWGEDDWLKSTHKAFYVVDGQQRLLTISIILFEILNLVLEESEFNEMGKEDFYKKYIAVEKKGGIKSYIVGYEADNPSYDFLKTRIFVSNTDEVVDLIQTTYTENLTNAKNFIFNKIKKYTTNELEKLFRIITQQLQFDFKEIQRGADIFVMFETMNMRGKRLSNLENLKNRLIYLSSLLISKSEDERKKLRFDINEAWKTVYEYLGKNKQNKLSDDFFLKNHWIMFCRFDRSRPEFYSQDIFEYVFTAGNLVRNEKNATVNSWIDYGFISDYIKSIKDSVKYWFVIHNPKHDHSKVLEPNIEVLNWLDKLNRIGFRSFEPLILTSFFHKTKLKIDDKTMVHLFQKMEQYVFVLFYIAFRRSNTGTYNFYARAGQVSNQKNDANALNINDLINEIHLWIYGLNYKPDGYYPDIKKFEDYLGETYIVNAIKEARKKKEQNDSEDEEETEGKMDKSLKGFMAWNGLRYFLQEYELELQGNQESKVGWTDKKQTVDLEQIYPENSSESAWLPNFQNYIKDKNKGSEYKQYLANSLGNIVLRSKPRDGYINSQFSLKKDRINPNTNEPEGYKYGSYSEMEIAEKYKDQEWTPQTILERGMHLLAFLERRWGIKFKDDYQKKKVLGLDFL